MTIRRALTVLIGTTLVLGAMGAGIGYGLGKFVPSYCRNVFFHGRDPGFDAIATGFGQGLTQGVIGGVLVALLLIALLCWHDIRLRHVSDSPVAHNNTFPWRFFFASGALLVLMGICATGAFVVGALMGEDGAYRRECGEQGRLIRPVIAADPAFKDVAIDECCCDAGWVILTGQVESQTDLTRLEERIIRVIGERRGKQAVSCVQVKQAAAEKHASP